VETPEGNGEVVAWPARHSNDKKPSTLATRKFSTLTPQIQGS